MPDIFIFAHGLKSFILSRKMPSQQRISGAEYIPSGLSSKLGRRPATESRLVLKQAAATEQLDLSHAEAYRREFDMEKALTEAKVASAIAAVALNHELFFGLI